MLQRAACMLACTLVIKPDYERLLLMLNSTLCCMQPTLTRAALQHCAGVRVMLAVVAVSLGIVPFHQSHSLSVPVPRLHLKVDLQPSFSSARIPGAWLKDIVLKMPLLLLLGCSVQSSSRAVSFYGRSLTGID